MKAIVRGLLTVLTVVVSLGLAGVTPAVAQEDIVACVTTVWQLTAGQTIPVGAVSVRNDRENIYVRYKLADDKAPNACFGTLHLWGGTNLDDVPKNNAGNPVPGQFPYSFDASGSRDYTFTIPIADRLEPACNAALSLYIVSHAEVDLDCNPATTDGDVSQVLIPSQRACPNSYRLMKSPMTRSCMRSVLEKHSVRRTSRLIRVRKLMCLLSIFWVFSLPT
jgi:hypothetical protein